jgi:hypothetical protein
MKAAEWTHIVKLLLPAADGWAYRGKLAYRPSKWVVVGVLGESSGWSNATYVWRAVSPLFVPTGALDLSFSKRVGPAGAVDDKDDDELRARIRSAADDLPSADHALRALADLDLGTGNARIFETAAYAQLILGAETRSADSLSQARHLPRLGDEPAWVDEMFARMATIENLISDGSSDEARTRLGMWASKSATNLRLALAP